MRLIKQHLRLSCLTLFCVLLCFPTYAGRKATSAPNVWKGAFWTPVNWAGNGVNNNCVIRYSTFSVSNLGVDPTAVRLRVKVLHASFGFNAGFSPGNLQILVENYGTYNFAPVPPASTISNGSGSVAMNPAPAIFETDPITIAPGLGVSSQFNLIWEVLPYSGRPGNGWATAHVEQIFEVEVMEDKGAVTASVDVVGASSGCLDANPAFMIQWQSMLAGRTTVLLNGGRPF